ncbi:MAG: hypothetical protein EHM23_20825 [Acidobacteria bacterium]|nr:MAG: hypothetical protein EHM23_20825 [Acidobacteriota bacterium]
MLYQESWRRRFPPCRITQRRHLLGHYRAASLEEGLAPSHLLGHTGEVIPESHFPAWPHAPTHLLSEAGTYIVTAATYRKLHHFRGAERLRFLHDEILQLAADFAWQLEAWAVFSNHYHFVGHSPDAEDGAKSLSDMLGELHERTAKWLNALCGVPGQSVWHNFWDTRLTFQRSYLARLSYVHQNPVKHGLVRVANQYPWCSAAWFERSARPAQVRTIYAMRIDQVRVSDDYDVAPEW